MWPKRLPDWVKKYFEPDGNQLKVKKDLDMDDNEIKNEKGASGWTLTDSRRDTGSVV